MRFVISLFIDVVLTLLATFAAFLMRDNFELTLPRLAEILPYFACTGVAALIVFPIFGVNRAFWRLSTTPDYLRVVAALLIVSIAAVAMTFAVNRLDGVPRSLPFLQFYLAATILVGARALYRLRHARRQNRRRTMTPLSNVEEQAAEFVLLIGLSRLTETYLQSVAEFAPARIRIAGILGHRSRHVGRRVAEHKVLGLPEQLARVLSELEVSGITVERIVVTAPFASLSAQAREEIAAAGRSGSVKIQYLSADLGFEPERSLDAPEDAASRPPLRFEIGEHELETMRNRRYWQLKRTMDIAGAVILLAASSVVLLVIGLGVAVVMGWPPVFWQQRPGLGGRPFRMYKFRTMGAPFAPDGRRIPDEARVSRLGIFLRRMRLDELPQLFNILRGDMSFVGPRPLLPCDQDRACRARLLIRPGLTGWAQVVGGRTIAAEDKAALDVWYVRNASVSLDLAIMLRTVGWLLTGERISSPLIERAWQDLRQAEVLARGFGRQPAGPEPTL